MRKEVWSVAMIVAVPVLAWSVRGWASVRESVESEAAQVARELATVRSERTLDSAAAIRLRVVGMAQQEWFIEARSASLGTAAVTRELIDVADRSGVTLESVQPVATRSSSIGKVRLKTSVTGTFRHVAEFMAAVEQGPPHVVIRETSITTQSGPRDPNQTDVVKAQLVLELLMELNNTRTGLAAR